MLAEPDIERLVEAVVARVFEANAPKDVAATKEATELAVERAVRDERIERDLRDHQAHLTTINGSQAKMAESLEALKGSLTALTAAFDAQLKVQQTLAEHVTNDRARGLSRWQVWFTGMMMIAAYGSIVAILISNG